MGNYFFKDVRLLHSGAKISLFRILGGLESISMKNLVKPALAAFVSFFFTKLCQGCMNPLFGKEKVICFDCQMSPPQTDHLLDIENIL
jgi:hypothetical protein